MEVYVDLVLALNFLVDFLLLLGTNRLLGFPAGAGRCALAAALGAVYAAACLLPGFYFLGSLPWRLVSLGLMSAAAFGLRADVWKRASVFALLSMALGGLAVRFAHPGFPGLALCAAGVWLLCRVALPGQGSREYVPVELTYQGRTERFLALKDTGNTLRDPVTGEPVLVISGAVAQRLTGLTARQLRSPVQTLAQGPIPGLRLIPYRTVGSGGLLLGLRFPEATVGRRKGSALAAFAPEGFPEEERHQALTGGI